MGKSAIQTIEISLYTYAIYRKIAKIIIRTSW